METKMRKSVLLTIVMLFCCSFLFAEQELIDKRGFQTKTYKIYADSSKYKTVFSKDPIHYLDSEGKFVEIPTTGTTRDSLYDLAVDQMDSRDQDTWNHDHMSHFGRYMKNVTNSGIEYEAEDFFDWDCWVGQREYDLDWYDANWSISRGIADFTGISLPWVDEIETWVSLQTSFDTYNDYYSGYGSFGDVDVGFFYNFNFETWPDNTDWNGLLDTSPIYTLDPDSYTSQTFNSYYDYGNTSNLCYMFSRYLLGIVNGFTFSFVKDGDSNTNHQSVYPSGETHAVQIEDVQITLTYYLAESEIDATLRNRFATTDIGGDLRYKESSSGGWSGWLDSGDSFLAIPDENYDCQTKRANLTHSGSNVKFHNWMAEVGTGLIDYNHEFTDAADYNYAYFEYIYSIDITRDGGLVEVLDPWYTTYGANYDTNENPLTWHSADYGDYDAFLDEGTYAKRYSLKVPNTYVSNYQYYEFDSWSGNYYTLYTYSGSLTVDTNEYTVTDVKFTNTSASIDASYDACGDGDVVGGDDGADILDIVAIVSYTLGTSTPSTEQEFAADLNCDDEYDGLDIVILVNFILESNRMTYPEGGALFISQLEVINQDSTLMNIYLANEAIVEAIQLEIDVDQFGYKAIGCESGSYVADLTFSSAISTDSSEVRLITYDSSGDYLADSLYGQVAKIWLTESGTTSNPDSTDFPKQVFANMDNDGSYIEHEYGSLSDFQSFVCGMDSTFCYGCTSSTALNYNYAASIDDSSCVYLLGDMNADESLNVLDITIMNNIILETITPTAYQEFAGDMNGDGDINSSDVVILVNIIQNQRGIDRDSGEGDILLSKVLNSYGIHEGEDASLTINLYNESLIQVLFAEVDLEENYEVSSVNLGTRTSNYDIQYRIFEDDSKLSFILYNLGGFIIEDGAGAILELGLQSTTLNKNLNPDCGEFTKIQIVNLEAEMEDYEVVSSSDMDRVLGTGMNISDIPISFELHPAYPNPFNPKTMISFDVAENSHVSVKIYDVMGREVAQLVNGIVEPGYHSISWNANDFASGIYFVRMVSPGFINTQKIMLLR